MGMLLMSDGRSWRRAVFMSRPDIGMTMRVDDVRDSVVQSLGLGQDSIRIEGRIDQGTGSGGFVADQITTYRHF